MKKIKFLKTIYNTSMNEDSMRVVFDKGEIYKIAYEDEEVFILEMGENSYYANNRLGIEKKLMNKDYIIIE